MTTAIKIDEFILADNIYKSGAIFSLSKEVQSLSGKFHFKKIGIWNVSIKDKSKIIVVKTKRKIKSNNLYHLAYKVVQEFLDFLSVEIRHYNSIKNHQNYILWYVEKNKNILEINSRNPLNIISRTQIQIKPVDKRKKIKILKNDLKEHHPSLRYFRLSRNNNDFIDAFRNQYLAFEQLLSSISPKKEGEWKWIKNTLNKSTKISEIAKILKCSNQNVESEFKSKIYDIRNALFHAKNGETYYLPEDLIIKKQIISSLQLLEYINWILLDEHYKTTISRGGMVINGLKQIANNFCTKEKQFQIMVSNKFEEVDKNGKLEDETKSLNLISNASYKLENCSAKIYAQFEMKNILSKFLELSRMCIVGSAGLYSVSQLEKPIILTDIIDTLKVNEFIDVTSDDFHQFYY